MSPSDSPAPGNRPQNIWLRAPMGLVSKGHEGPCGTETPLKGILCGVPQPHPKSKQTNKTPSSLKSTYAIWQGDSFSILTVWAGGAEVHRSAPQRARRGRHQYHVLMRSPVTVPTAALLTQRRGAVTVPLSKLQSVGGRELPPLSGLGGRRERSWPPPTPELTLQNCPCRLPSRG